MVWVKCNNCKEESYVFTAGDEVRYCPICGVKAKEVISDDTTTKTD